MTRRVLFTFSVLHARAEMARLLAPFQQRGWDVHLLIGFRGEAADALEEAMRRIGVTTHRVADPWAYGAAAPAAGKASRAGAAPAPKAKRRPRVPVPLRPLVNAALYARNGLRQRAEARRLLARIRPDAIVSNNFHSCCEFDNAMNVEAGRCGVARACVLTSPLVAGLIARRARLSNYRAGMIDAGYRTDANWLARLLSRVRPGWSMGEGTERILCWPADKLLGGRISGLLPADVWQSPSGEFERIYAQSEKSRQLLVASGVPEAIIRVFGPPRLDPVIAAAADGSLADEIAGRFGLMPGEPYLLYNVEPSWEHHYCDRETHFARVERIATLLARLPLRTIVSLHPLCNASDYAPLLDRPPGITISREAGIERLYPGCRLALSFGCSTNAYAVIWNKPLVMYDWFGIRADPWRWSLYNQPGLDVVTEMDDLEPAIRAALEQSGARAPAAGHAGMEAAPRIVEDIIALASRAPRSGQTRHA